MSMAAAGREWEGLCCEPEHFPHTVAGHAGRPSNRPLCHPHDCCCPALLLVIKQHASVPPPSCPHPALLQVTSLQELKALETQINEFGQTPKQLFTHAHPPRLVQPLVPDRATVFSNSTASSSSSTAADGGSPSVDVSAAAAATAAPAAVGQGLPSSSASKARLKGGGEDAAGGALCFALLSTILAAAAPELDGSAAAEDAAAANRRGAPVQAAAAAAAAGPGTGLQRAGSGSSLSLSPVSSSDLLSAAPCIPDAASPARPAAREQQQQQLQTAGGLRGMLPRLMDGANALAASAAATVASGMPSSGAASYSKLVGAGLSGLPLSRSKSGMKLSLSWMQQQFAEGLALSSSSSSNDNTRAAAGGPQPPAPSAAADSIVPATAAVHTAAGKLSSSPAAAAAQGSAGNSGRVGAAGIPAHWPRSLPEQLLVKKSVRLQSEPLTAVAATQDGAVFVAGHSGLLRVLEAPQLSTIRSANVEDHDLLCLSLLPAATSAVHVGPAGGIATATAATGNGGELHLPLVLAGSQAGKVLAYAATAGRLLGGWAAHGDAVSSMLQLGSAGDKLATASYDCSVKVGTADRLQQ